jgi:hypothetical protein
MSISRVSYLLLFATGLVFITAGRAKAQGDYYVITTDGSYIYTDVYGSSGAPNTCPTYTTIETDINGYVGSGSASYPATAHASASTPATDGVNYSWTRDITHYGEQRGGSCGAFLELLRSWTLSVRSTYYTGPSVDSFGACQWASLACRSGTPSCTSGFTIYPQPTCSNYVWIRFLYLGTPTFSECSWYGSAYWAGGPGVCT